MLVCYSMIGLISAILMPEVRDRDLSLLKTPQTRAANKAVGNGQYI
jgi:MHS family metabolite:H+ symporter-like MFS transporter